MSVYDNVLIGAHARGDAGRAPELIEHLGLTDVARLPVAGLPYGTQKRVETARALISSPRLLLLDEPAGGLNHEEVAALADSIRQMREGFKLTILLVEHHMNFVMGALRPGARARLRAADRVRHARRGAAQPRRDRGLPRRRGAGGRCRPCLSSTDVEARYGAVKALHGVSLDGRRGRGRRRARRERRRQDDDPARDLGHGAPLRARSRSRAPGSRASPEGVAPPGHRARPRGTGDVRRADRAREPAPRRLHAPGRPQGRPRARPGRLPGARRAPAPAGRDALWRRAADARGRPGADAAPAPAAPRRAVARPGADRRARALPHRARAERARRASPCSSWSRTRSIALADRRPRLRARGRARRRRRPERRAARERVRPRRYLGY